jgi:hypothetical protein
MHVWLLLFAYDLALTSESEVGLEQQLNALQQFCVEHGLIMKVKKTKVMVFNSADPYQEFVFEVDVIEHVQNFKYLGILLKTTPNLDNVVEHLIAANRCSMFALNHHYVELRIMNVKLCYDLFNTLMRSITNYACEVCDAPLSSLLDPLEGLSMLNCEKLELEGRSRLPALKGVRGACWKSRD